MQNVGNYQHPGRGSNFVTAFGFLLGTAGGATVSLAVDCFGHFLYRHVDAERRRGLADDAADHESINGWTGAGGWSGTGVPGDPAGRRACGHGGPASFSIADPGMDGARFSDARHPDADQLREALGTAVVHLFAGPRCGDE